MSALLRGGVAPLLACRLPTARHRRPAVCEASARRAAAQPATVVEERVVAGTRVRVLADGTLVYSFGQGASPPSRARVAEDSADAAEEGGAPPAGSAPPAVHFLGPPPPLLARVAVAQGWAVSYSDDSGGATAEREASDKARRNGCAKAFLITSRQRKKAREPALGGGGAPPGAVVVAATSASAAGARHPVASSSPAAWARAATDATAVCVVAAAHGAPLGAAMLAAALRAGCGGGDVAVALSAQPRGSSGGARRSGARVMMPFRPPRRLVLDAALGQGGLDGIRPAIAVVLNLMGASATSSAPSVEDTAAAADAERLARSLRPGGALLLCGDDLGVPALLALLATATRDDGDDVAIAAHEQQQQQQLATDGGDACAAPAARALVTFGMGARNDWRAVACAPNAAGGTDFTAVRGGAPVARVSLRAPGETAVVAALGALAAATLLAAAEPTASPGGGLDMVSAAAMASAVASGSDAAAADVAADALRRCRGVARSTQRIGRAFAGRHRRELLCYDNDAPRPEAAAAALAAVMQRHDRAQLWAVAAAAPGLHGDAAATRAHASALAAGTARVVAIPAPGASLQDAEALAVAVRARGVPAAAAAAAEDAVVRLAFELTHMPPAPGEHDAAADEAGAPPVVLLTLGPPFLAPLGPALLRRLRHAQ